MHSMLLHRIFVTNRILLTGLHVATVGLSCPSLHRPLATREHERHILYLRLRYHRNVHRIRSSNHHRKHA
jgi:hypothetical protein